jgi:F0F1-type ATP synthase membrane subunit b/b'
MNKKREMNKCQVDETARIIEQCTQRISQEIDKEANELKELAQQESSQIIAKAYQESADILAGTRTEAEHIVAKAREKAEQITEEARRAAENESASIIAKAFDEAGNIIAKAEGETKQIIMKAEETANSEASKKSEKIITKAKQDAEKIIKEARGKVQNELEESARVITEAKQRLEQLIKMAEEETRKELEYQDEVAAQLSTTARKPETGESIARVETSTAAAKEDSTELYQGHVTVEITPEGSLPQLVQLQEHLRQVPDLELASIGFSENGTTLATLVLAKPLPLVRVLEEIPTVESVAAQGNNVQLVLIREGNKSTPGADKGRKNIELTEFLSKHQPVVNVVGNKSVG